MDPLKVDMAKLDSVKVELVMVVRTQDLDKVQILKINLGLADQIPLIQVLSFKALKNLQSNTTKCTIFILRRTISKLLEEKLLERSIKFPFLEYFKYN